jgi:gamma-glutamyl AIG2-like cyclotransferase
VPTSQRQYVFGYGSLAASLLDGGYVTELRGHRRRWGVAMDNRRDLPGYKWYRLAATGARPAVFVAFLDVAPASGGEAVNGVCRPLLDGELASLDARERNYERVDVTALVSEARGRVWAYVGSAAGRARLDAGISSGTAALSRAYRAHVEAGFRALGAGELDAFHASTDPPPDGCAPLDLERLDLP